MFALVCVLVLLASLCWQASRLHREGRKLLTPGYLTKPASRCARLFRCITARFIVYLAIGRLNIIHRERLNVKGRLVITPNHQMLQDALVMPAVLGLRELRYMVLDTQLKGLRAPFAVWFGAIVVPSGKRSWIAARQTIRTMRTEPDTSLLSFPQGRRMHEKPLSRADFHEGTMFIASHVGKTSAAPLYVVPVGIYYDRDPSHATATRKLLIRLRADRLIDRVFVDTTYGVTVVIGEPIPLAEFGEDFDITAATDIIYLRVEELEALAKQHCFEQYPQGGKECHGTLSRFPK
jgi:1-acyl-sn-glycerol-3-phosphate acyltransferase